MIKTFLKYIEFEKRYSKHTIISYHTDLQQFKNFLATIYPELTLVNVDYRILRSWIVSLVDNNIENTSINRKIASLRSFYKFLLKREHIQEDPTWKLKVLKKSKRLISQWKKYLDSLSSWQLAEDQCLKTLVEIHSPTKG